MDLDRTRYVKLHKYSFGVGCLYFFLFSVDILRIYQYIVAYKLYVNHYFHKNI